MSLRIWLPLNGDLRNNGTYDLNFTNVNATIDNNGKIGKCYSLNASTSSIDCVHDKTIWKDHPMSYAIWFKSDQSKASGTIMEISADLCIAYSYNSSGVKFSYWRAYLNSSGKRTGDNQVCSTYFDASKWHHISFVFNSGINKLYVDGILVQTWDRTSLYTDNNPFLLGSGYNKITIGRSYGSTSFVGGFVNDARIYDHALSAKEVKEISKGLVCHYKLDGFNSGVNSNMLLNAPKSYTPTSYCGYQLNFTENLIANETYTLQLWDVEVSHSAKTGSALGIWVYWGGGSTGLFSFTSANSDLVNGKADYLVKTFTITSSQARGSGTNNAWFNMYNSVGYVAGTLNMKIGKWKLEKGSIATPYCRTASEMGIDTTKIIDSSGYSYNGTITGNLTVNSDSTRNSLSTAFNGTSYFHLTSPSSEVKTISLWAKWDTIPSGQSVIFVDYKSRIGLGLMSTGILCGSYTPSSYKTFSKSNIVANQWYHFVIVSPNGYSNIARKLYINGVEQVETTNTSVWTYSLDQLQIGKRSTTSDGFKGSISDFRAYTTALSADDILELYQVGAKIDKSGNMYGYELKED